MNALAEKKIAVLMGGPGSERAVSFATGTGIAKALRSLGATVTEVDVHDANFVLPNDTEIAFIALHGTCDEDGQVQQILEDRGVAYTGEGVEESRVAFDKILSKEKFRAADVETPDWEIVQQGEGPSLPLPFVIKPPREGSTVGVHIVMQEAEVARALADVAKFGQELLVDGFIA